MSIAARKHDCPTCRCTEPVDVDAMIAEGELLERARDIIAEHHQWQNEADGLVMEFERDGKINRVDISGEYVDSSLCEKTTEVLSALNRKLSGSSAASRVLRNPKNSKAAKTARGLALTQRG